MNGNHIDNGNLTAALGAVLSFELQKEDDFDAPAVKQFKALAAEMDEIRRLHVLGQDDLAISRVLEHLQWAEDGFQKAFEIEDRKKALKRRCRFSRDFHFFGVGLIELGGLDEHADQIEALEDFLADTITEFRDQSETVYFQNIEARREELANLLSGWAFTTLQPEGAIKLGEEGERIIVERLLDEAEPCSALSDAAEEYRKLVETEAADLK